MAINLTSSLIFASVCVLASTTSNGISGDSEQSKHDVVKQHAVWVEEGYEAIIKGVGLKTLKQVTKEYAPVLVKCFDDARDLRARAKCVAESFKHRASQQKASIDYLIGRETGQTPRSTKLSITVTPIRRTTPTLHALHQSTTEQPQKNVKKDALDARLARWNRLAGHGRSSNKIDSVHDSRNREKRNLRLVDNQQTYESYLTATGSRQASQPIVHQSAFVLMPEAALGINSIPQMIQEVFVPKPDSRKQKTWKPRWHRFQRIMKLSRFNEDHLLKFFDSVGYVDPQTPEEKKMKLLMDSVKTFSDVAKKNNVSGLSLFSPRLLSVAPSDPAMTNVFSPDLLSLYEDEKPVSFQNVLNVSHFFATSPQFRALQVGDKDAWMDLVMETSGAAETVTEVLDWLDGNLTRTDFEKFAQSHLRLIEHWDNFLHLVTGEQERQLRDDGFAFVEPFQFDQMFSKVYNLSDVEHEVNLYKRLTIDERNQLLEDEIREMAGEPDAMRSWGKRMKQALLSPALFSPAVLSPGVFGHVTLSPNLFNPAVLSPVALSPVTLSPFIGNPGILSPYVLSPTTLSPYLLTPFVLSPAALSPTVLSPYLLGPYVLCPNAMNPNILSPNGLGGALLGPAALSPSLLSPGFLNFDVLSPTVLSRK